MKEIGCFLKRGAAISYLTGRVVHLAFLNDACLRILRRPESSARKTLSRRRTLRIL